MCNRTSYTYTSSCNYSSCKKFNFEEANTFAEGRAAEILEATDGYKDYSLNAAPALDGTSNYLVSGEIRAYKDYSGASVTAEQAKKNIEAAARKVVIDANPSISTTKPCYSY